MDMCCFGLLYELWPCFVFLPTCANYDEKLETSMKEYMAWLSGQWLILELEIG